MNAIKNFVGKARNLYAKPGAPFHKVWPLFDALETFLLTPGHTAGKSGPHVRDYVDLKRTMATVIIALVPALLWSFYNNGLQHFQAIAGMVGGEAAAASPYPDQVGWLQWLVFGSDYMPDVSDPRMLDILVFGLQQMVPIVFVSYFVGLNIEGLFAVLRKEEISEGYLVTGMLIALIVPASVPLWQLALSVAFAVVLAKEVFGGTGQNIFNVALMSRAFLFFSYPAQLSGDTVWVAGNGSMNLIDGYSHPTALAAAASAELQSNHIGEGYVESSVDAVQQAGYTWWELFVGLVPGSAGETSALAVLIGAVLLVVTGVASWRTMVSGVLGLVAMAGVLNVFAGHLDGLGSYPAHWHLVSGGFAFGIVFMATDPVSSPETDWGKWIYGALIGVVTILVRAVNPAYPEGVMLAILLLNAFAPTIDHFVVASNIRQRKRRLSLG